MGRAGLALAAASWSGLSGCKKKGPARTEVLEATVRALVIPDVHAVHFHSQQLAEGTRALAEHPGAEATETARARWRDAVLAWKRAYCFRNGPLVTTSAFLRAVFWPARPVAVDAIARGKQPIDDALVRELGVDEKGLFAIEHLLFAPGNEPPLVERPGAEGARGRALVAGLARAVTLDAEAAVRALGDGSGYVSAFAARDRESLSLVINQLVDTVETVANSRLARLAALGDRPPRPAEVEGLASAMVFRIPEALVAGTERLYLGAGGRGLGDLVQAISPDIAARARAAFAHTAAALAALARLPQPEALARHVAIEDATKAAKELELALKVDVASALGVTLVFTGNDGD
jgi:predicted lipoprotein